MKTPQTNRFRFLFFFFVNFIVVNQFFRLLLLVKEHKVVEHGSYGFFAIFKIFIEGLFFDCLGFGLVASFLGMFLVFWPDRFFKQSLYLRAVSFFWILIFTFILHAEWFFWDEFTSRFNFIAIDYLIYTKEVVGNIRESYSMPMILFSVLAFGVVIFILSNPFWHWTWKIHQPTSLKRRFLFLFLPLGTFLFVFYNKTLPSLHYEDFTLTQLSRNGIFELMSAFRNNNLDYYQFYKTIPELRMQEIIEARFNRYRPEVTSTKKNNYFVREFKGNKNKEQFNVILITVESLSANFLGRFGNNQKITPNLDRLAEESLFFTNIYATGTRTVRGLEALSLSLPPTPGYSVVKRPRNENLCSAGSIFYKNNYDVKFLYGGYGYFDNMNYFFANNHFQIVDRTNFEPAEIEFANVWGVADENLFTKVLKEADLSYKAKKKFFSFVMTTSNHRPFTYPDEKIDIPSHTSREGGVKYTDYAIGKLIEAAKSKPWFDKTIFVIVADHSAQGRGKIEIPVETYHIPLMIYAPALIKPQTIETVASQIDIMPTIAGLMELPYLTKNFGEDILKMKKADERFFVATYQKLGFYSQGKFISLGPRHDTQVFDYNTETRKLGALTSNEALTEEAVAYYQYASFLLAHDYYGDTDL